MTVRPFSTDKAEIWDGFVRAQPQATILHERRFLDYHGDRFIDQSVLIETPDQKIAAVFPAARDPSNADVIISHPGATYGGLVCGHKEPPDRVWDMIEMLCDYYREKGLERVVWKQPPGHLAAQRQGVFDWALWVSGAKLMRRELWNLVELDLSERRSKGHKWATKKAGEAGLTVATTDQPADFADFHQLLSENLKARHHSAPVHSLADLKDLGQRLGKDAELVLCWGASGQLVAGVLLFRVTDTATHTQYICCSDEGREMFALNHLIEHIIRKLRGAGTKTLSFGASTEPGGIEINSGLYAFKAGFGRSSATLDVYELSLRDDPLISENIMRRGRPTKPRD